MDWSQIRSAAIVSLLAVVTIVGFVAAPVSAIDAGDSIDGDETGIDNTTTTTETQDDTQTKPQNDTQDDTQTDTQNDRQDGTQIDTLTDSQTGSQADTQADDGVPEEVCTDITGLVHEDLPYDQVIWVNDLPEDAQPPGVPWSILTPRTVGSIGFGAAPNQCDVVDPNDPPYDPTEDDVDPDGGADVVEETEEGTTLLIVNGTLNQSGEGPGGEATIEFDAAEDGEVNPEIRLNDGEKDYGVDPGLEYWDDGTIVAENDVTVMGLTAGGEVDCIGEECNLDIRGAPKFVDYPSVPSHSTDDPRENTADEGTSGTSDAGLTADRTGADETDTTPTATSDDGQSDGSTGDPSNDADPSSDGDDSSSDDATSESTETDASDGDVIASQDPADGNGMPDGGIIPGLPGLGVMGLLGVTLIGSRLR